MGGASFVLRPDVGLRQVLRLCSKLDILEERSSHRGLRLATLWPWPYQLPVLSSPFTAPGLHSPLGVVFLRLLSPPASMHLCPPTLPLQKRSKHCQKAGRSFNLPHTFPSFEAIPTLPSQTDASPNKKSLPTWTGPTHRPFVPQDSATRSARPVSPIFRPSAGVLLFQGSLLEGREDLVRILQNAFHEEPLARRASDGRWHGRVTPPCLRAARVPASGFAEKQTGQVATPFDPNKSQSE